MVAASFMNPDDPHPAPFPLIPTGVHIVTMLGALYPHFDIIDDKVTVRTSPGAFADSIRFTTLGCCVLTAGYYACQFVRALRPLRHEYLGTLVLLQLLYVAVVAARAWFFPADALEGLGGTAVGLVVAALSLVLVRYDRYHPDICPEVAVKDAQNAAVERLPPNSDAAAKAEAKERAAAVVLRREAARRTAAWLIPAATHATWLLLAASLNAACATPYISGAVHIPAAVQSALSYAAAVPYLEYATALVDGLALLRLAAAVAGGRKKKEAGAEGEAGRDAAKEAKAAEAKSD